jgi:hypothetical protein
MPRGTAAEPRHGHAARRLHLSPSSRTTFAKRQKERARQEKQKSKAERRTQRKEQGSTPADSMIDAEAAANQLLTPEEIMNQGKVE